MEWRPTERQVWWAIGIVIALLFFSVLFWWLWGVLAGYIQPKTPTDKKDLVNIFVVIAAGVVGTLTAIAAVGNLYVSRRNLQNAQDTLRQQRDLEERRAQDDALQAYFEQMGSLLTEHELMDTENADDPKRLLARAQTLTLLERLGSESDRAKRKKRELIRFLCDSGLIIKDKTIVVLVSADLSGADLRGTNLSGTNLSRAKLDDANLSRANLIDADLSYAELTGADLGVAELGHTYLIHAILSGASLRGAYLIHTILSDADLSGANLSRAELSGTSYRDVNLSRGSSPEVSVISSKPHPSPTNP